MTRRVSQLDRAEEVEGKRRVDRDGRRVGRVELLAQERLDARAIGGEAVLGVVEEPVLPDLFVQRAEERVELRLSGRRRRELRGVEVDEHADDHRLGGLDF